jgi:hypothetical protein
MIEKISYNKLKKKIASLEKKIQSNKFDNDLLRDKLQFFNRKAQAMEDNFNPILVNQEVLKNKLQELLAGAYNEITDDSGKGIFEVDYSNDDIIQITPQFDNDLDKDKYANLESFYNSALNYIDTIGINISESTSENVKLNIKDLLNRLVESLERKEIDFNDGNVDKKSILIGFSSASNGIVQEIFNVLENNNLAGLTAHEKFENLQQVIPENGMGETTMAKKFNLKRYKTADKVFDSIREKPIMNHDLQYLSRHPKSMPGYEEAYISDYIYQRSVMDKYYSEQVNAETGEYEGGYIEDRFFVEKNTEGNSMRARPDGTVPDRVNSYSTERRLEVMRDNDERDYQPSEGSKPEMQNKKVASINYEEDHDLFKVRIANKVMYFDTKEELDLFQKFSGYELKKKKHNQSL